MSQFYLETPGGTAATQFDCPDGGNTVPDASGVITLTEGAGIDITCSTPNEINFAFDITEVPTIADTFTADTGSAQPASNNLNILGITVANATNTTPLETSGATDTITAEIQVGAAITGAPVDKNDAGLVSADDTLFTIDANGWLSSDGTQIGQTITGDTGGALSPTAGNWNILGGTGVNTAGSGSTLTVHADGSGQVGAVNLAIFYSAGTATIKGADGNDLSASNPAYVTISSNVTSGELVTYTLTSNVTFDDSAGASSTFAGSLFGFDTGDTTSTVAAAIPFLIHAAATSTDTNPKFFLSRIPWPSINSGFLADGASGNADSMQAILSLETLGASLSDYNNSDSIVIGQILLDIDGSDDWTVDEVNPPSFGIGNFNFFNNTLIETGIYGAATTSHFLDNGGTAPTVLTGNDARYFYKIDHLTNQIFIDMHVTLSGSPAGAVDALMNLPVFGQNNYAFVGVGTYFDGGASGNVYPIYFRKRVSSAAAGRQMELLKGDGTTGKWQYNEMASGDVIIAQFTYRLA